MAARTFPVLLPLGDALGSLRYLGQCLCCAVQFMSTHEHVWCLPSGALVCKACGPGRAK